MRRSAYALVSGPSFLPAVSAARATASQHCAYASALDRSVDIPRIVISFGNY
jgi:hypothetical protein